MTGEQHVLKDGTKVTLRPIREEDGAALRRAFQRLSPESRYRRFFASVSELTDAVVHYLTCVDDKNHVAIVAVVDSLDLKQEEGVGVARFIRLTNEPDVAEAAVTVVDDFQHKGLGRILLRALAARARGEGIKTFRAEVLLGNDPMAKLLVDSGAIMRKTDEGTVSFDVPIDEPGSAREERSLLERFLRAAATSVSILSKSLRIPGT